MTAQESLSAKIYNYYLIHSGRRDEKLTSHTADQLAAMHGIAVDCPPLIVDHSGEITEIWGAPVEAASGGGYIWSLSRIPSVLLSACISRTRKRLRNLGQLDRFPVLRAEIIQLDALLVDSDRVALMEAFDGAEDPATVIDEFGDKV